MLWNRETPCYLTWHYQKCDGKVTFVLFFSIDFFVKGLKLIIFYLHPSLSWSSYFPKQTSKTSQPGPFLLVCKVIFQYNSQSKNHSSQSTPSELTKLLIFFCCCYWTEGWTLRHYEGWTETIWSKSSICCPFLSINFLVHFIGIPYSQGGESYSAMYSNYILSLIRQEQKNAWGCYFSNIPIFYMYLVLALVCAY